MMWFTGFIFILLAFALFAVLRFAGANALLSICLVATVFVGVAIYAELGVIS